MGCTDGYPSKTPQEIAQEARTWAFRCLLEKFNRVPMGHFTLEESLLIHRLYVADAYTFPPKISEEELKILQAAEARIFRSEQSPERTYVGEKREW